MERSMVDAASGGALMDKTATAASTMLLSILEAILHINTR